MLKKFRVWALRVAFVALAVVLIAGCDNLFGSSSKKSGGGGATGVQNLPSRFSVNAPASVRGGGVAASNLSSSSFSGSGAYQELKNQVQWMEMEQMNVGLEFIIADRMIGTAFQLGTAQSGPYDFPITQGVVDDVLNIFQQSPWWADFGTEFEQQLNQAVGQSFPIDFSYEPVSGRYDHKLETTFSDEEGEDKTVLFWDTAKKNVSLVFEWDDAEFGSGSGVYTYNDDTRTATAINEFKSGEFSDYTEITLREATDADLSAKNGVFVTFNSRGQSGSFNYRYNTRGYADDEGGQIRITSTFDGASYSSDFTFDASGNEISATYAFLDDFDFGDMSGAEVLGDIGLGDAGFFRVDVSGVTKDGYYLISDTTSPDETSYDDVVGDATGIANGRLEVMVWDASRATGNLYAYAVDFDDDATPVNFTAIGPFQKP